MLKIAWVQQEKKPEPLWGDIVSIPLLIRE